MRLLTGKPVTENGSIRIQENFNFFYDELGKLDVNLVYKGLQKMIVVDVALERDKDNPQLIFESLNSTGLNLSQADLIRNYILMGQKQDFQKYLYEKYWYPMEQNFGDNIGIMPWFMRDFLTMKLWRIPNIAEVYDTFKVFFNKVGSKEDVEAVVSELFTYSNYYVRIALNKEPDEVFRDIFKTMTKLRMDTSYPFLIATYGDFEKQLITRDEFVEILSITRNYVFRRAICGIPTNSLNKTFATFYKKIKVETYLDSVKAGFLLMDGYRRFPDDVEFFREMQIKDVYNFRSRNYLLESLENFKRKERVNVENYTIEHVLPQKEDVSDEWKSELGANWKWVKETYLHSLGNLTLTRYNSEMSAHPFAVKKSIPGGFMDSPLFLNSSIRSAEVWNEAAINKRSKELAGRGLLVWPYPTLSADRLNLFREEVLPQNAENYGLGDYEFLQNGILDLYTELAKRVLNLHASVRVEYKKLYIAFKVQTNFLDVVPQKRRLRLSLNMNFTDIKDPRGWCKDVSRVGRWGNGDVEIGLESHDQLDYVMEMVDQALDVQLNE
jgi:predicted transport protein/uncharacterized protein with ParB-like and HNH nuclease domain